MKYTKTNCLNSSILTQLDALPQEGYTPFYMETMNSTYCAFHFLSDNNRLISFIGIMPVSSDTVELTAYTAPAFRRQGYFTFLLKNVMQELSAFPSLRILSEGKLSFPFLRNTLSHQEYLMALPHDSLYPATPVKTLTVAEYVFKSPEESEYIYVLKKQNTPLGIMIITYETASNSACLHHMKIRRPFRKQGYGFFLVSHALTLFRNNTAIKNCDIVLHVTSTNTAAFHIYRKLGFEIIQSLDYYRLEEPDRQ